METNVHYPTIHNGPQASQDQPNNDQRDQTIRDQLRQADKEMNWIQAEICKANATTKATLAKRLEVNMIKIYGNIQLDGDIRELLAHSPDFLLLQDLLKIYIEREFLRGLTTIRWS